MNLKRTMHALWRLSLEVKVWIALGLIFLLFTLWHQPLRGPLTKAEIQDSLGPFFELMVQSGDPQAQQVLDFFESDDGRPFYMLNLNELPLKTPETEEAGMAYASYMLPRLFSRACYPVLITDRITTIGNSMGDEFEAIDDIVIVRYRSRRDLLEIISDETFASELQHKNTSLAGWFAAPIRYRPLITPSRVLLIVLLSIGIVTLLFGRRGSSAD